MAPVVHGYAKRVGKASAYSAEYRAWRAMKNRCLNKKQARFKDYGARGITVCARWLEGEDGKPAFSCFLSDVGRKPSPQHFLGRRNVSRGYEPDNVLWLTRAAAARNTRATRRVRIQGVVISFAEAIERFGKVDLKTAAMRVHRGWDEVAAIVTPRQVRP